MEHNLQRFAISFCSLSNFSLLVLGLWLSDILLLLLLPLICCYMFAELPRAVSFHFAYTLAVLCGHSIWSVVELSLSFFNLSFNWKKVALQYCLDFCCTTTQISHNYICNFFKQTFHSSEINNREKNILACFILSYLVNVIWNI